MINKVLLKVSGTLLSFFFYGELDSQYEQETGSDRSLEFDNSIRNI